MVEVKTAASRGERRFRPGLQIKPDVSNGGQINLCKSNDTGWIFQYSREELLNVGLRRDLFKIVRIKPDMKLLNGAIKAGESRNIFRGGTSYDNRMILLPVRYGHGLPCSFARCHRAIVPKGTDPGRKTHYAIAAACR